MSDNGDFSVWSNDEIELLDNINKEIKLDQIGSGGDSSDSESSKMNKSNQESWKVLQKNEVEWKSDEENVRQSKGNAHSHQILNQQSNITLSKLKLHFSSNDLTNLDTEDTTSNEQVPKTVASFTHSNSYNCLSNNENPAPKKYDHVQSKIKQYFKAKSPARAHTTTKETKVMSKVIEVRECDNREYLEVINLRLKRELEEKNALITKLQENYENLLLKYAEAQNKIDHLRFKSFCGSTECQIHSSVEQNSSKTIHSPGKIFCGDEEDQACWKEGRSKGDAGTSHVRNNLQDDSDMKKVGRPTSLSLDPKTVEKDGIRVGTPTDSEDMSSVVTSMSGHSKILKSLNVYSANRNFNLMKYSHRDYMLGDNAIVHDAFNKVKNWQNSLPPLEYIETPETALYDIPSVQVSHSPKGNHTEDEEEGAFLPDGDPNPQPLQKEHEKSLPQSECMGAVSLPSALSKKKNASRLKQEKDPESSPSGMTRRRKKPQLLRCSSLPTSDTPKSSRRNIYIPPLDLENLTLSDAESSRGDFYEYERTNIGTSSSYLTSQSGSMELPSQTYRTNYKEITTEYSDFPFSGRPSFNKSTSITPERCNDAFPSFLKPNNFCHVCGEKLEERSLLCRSSSYQTLEEMKDAATKAMEKRGKYPFSRSVSFNSDTSSFRKCTHTQDCPLRRTKEDSLEKFDMYTKNLKARSQVVMKAIAAHVNNS